MPRHRGTRAPEYRARHCPRPIAAPSTPVNSGGQEAGDGTRTRGIQLGRHIRGFVFGLRRRRRLSALIHLTAVGRTSVAPDLGSLNGTTVSQWSSRQPVRHPVEKARSFMPGLRVPAGLPRFPPEPPGADPERHDQHDPRHCAAGRRQESFRKQAAAKENHQVREEGRVPRARPSGSRWPGGPHGAGQSTAAIGSSRVRTS
jgi:hypothetical protein